MTEREAEWVKRNYPPKVELPALPAPVDLGALTTEQHKSIRAYVTGSMERDLYYGSHTREQCATEWRKRYDDQEALLREHALEGRYPLATAASKPKQYNPNETELSL